MNNRIFRVFTAMFIAVGFMTSCSMDDTADDALPRLKVDKNRVEIIRDGNLSNGNPATVNVTANKGYNVTSDSDWLSVEKPTGQGWATLTILAQPNNSGAVREGHLTVTSASLSETITVKQTLALNTDDGKEAGFVYFYDDFEWCVGGTDAIADKAAGDARNIYTWDYKGNGFTDPLPTFQKSYDDLNSNAKTVYTMKGFIKFDKTNTITAIAIKDNGIEPGKTSNVKVSFKGARHGSDKIQIVVGIEGDGTIEGGETAGSRMVSQVLPITSDSYTWSEVSVNISGVSSNTKIIIGDVTYVKDNINNQGTFRWYLDDLKIERIGISHRRDINDGTDRL